MSSDVHLLVVQLALPLYTNDILRWFGLNQCKPALCLMVKSFSSSLHMEDAKAPHNVGLYQQVFGSLLYLT